MCYSLIRENDERIGIISGKLWEKKMCYLKKYKTFDKRAKREERFSGKKRKGKNKKNGEEDEEKKFQL